jgi:hypothetical protein
MHRARASAPPDAIRIEDEVWQEAFRETTRPRSRARLRSHDGDRVETRSARTRPGFAASTTSMPEPDELPARTDLPAAPRADERPAHRTDEPPVRRTDEPPVRRTVTITGRGTERNLWPADAGRRRPARRAHERAGFKPDRVAMWAVFLGLLLIFVAAASAHT